MIIITKKTRENAVSGMGFAKSNAGPKGSESSCRELVTIAVRILSAITEG